MRRPKTVFCDIDGTLVRHSPPAKVTDPNCKMELLPETLDAISEWDRRGYNIVLTTGRKESLRSTTEKQLSDVGIFYDKLVMGVGGGDRILINDNKEDGRQSCWAVNPPRDTGLAGICFHNLSAISMKYFKSITEKNINTIEKILDNDVVLTDWDGEHTGISEVVKTMRIMLDTLPDLNIEVLSLTRSGNKVFAQIMVHTGSSSVPVVDVLEFTKLGKIKSVTAYRGN